MLCVSITAKLQQHEDTSRGRELKIILLSLTSKTYITILYHGMYVVISTNLVKGPSHFTLFAIVCLIRKI